MPIVAGFFDTFLHFSPGRGVPTMKGSLAERHQKLLQKPLGPSRLLLSIMRLSSLSLLVDITREATSPILPIAGNSGCIEARFQTLSLWKF